MPEAAADPAVLARRRAFGRRLRDVREQARLSQAEVAAAAGLSRPFYVGIEAGQRNVGLDNVFAIASALGVDVVDLFTDLYP